VEFPLRGEWVAVRSPATRIPSHGTDQLAQRYAFDLWRVDARRAGYHPASTLRMLTLGVRTRECYGWGQPVHAPMDGEIVRASDRVTDREWLHPVREMIGAVWTAITFQPDRIWDVTGNHVVLRRGDVHAAFAHLAFGSVAVGEGTTVGEGDQIGRIGHNGNSTAPHLHFQLMDGPDPRTANPIPCAFREYEVLREGTWQRVRNGVPSSSDRIRSVDESSHSSPPGGAPLLRS
jgi:hypothetical protein